MKRIAQQFQFVSTPKGEVVKIAARGRAVLSEPMISKGAAFTEQEREDLELEGLLPAGVASMQTQMNVTLEQFRHAGTNLAKNRLLLSVLDRNEVLFYRLVSENLEEMLPIIYTPTIGEAIEAFSHWFNHPRGVFLSINDPEAIPASLRSYHHGPDDVDLIVVTDSEGILGIGDQGVGGIQIAIGKLSVYTAAAGIHPRRVLPVVLDTGTNNLELLSDDAYLGCNHARIRGERYDDFIDQFVHAATTLYPNALIHWEDFGPSTAHRLLDKYKDTVCTFNDDIQGTASVVVAAMLSAIKASDTPMEEQKIVIYGGGTAGIGIADLIRETMESRGMSPEEAASRFWILGSKGLIHEGILDSVRPFQRPYARSSADVQGWRKRSDGSYDLETVMEHVNPTILIGTSAQPAAFSERMIRKWATKRDRPIIFPLSNPTSKAEAIPSDLIEWTNGRALIATGSPFEPIKYKGTTYEIAQANNAFVFPGIGLGTIVSQATLVTQRMIAAAAEAVSDLIEAQELGSSLLPTIGQIRSVSAAVAIYVAKAAAADGIAKRPLVHPVQEVIDAMWKPTYPKVEACTQDDLVERLSPEVHNGTIQAGAVEES